MYTKNKSLPFFIILFELLSFICCPSKECVCKVTDIPLSFLDNKSAYVPLTIDNNDFFLLLDIGSFSSITINKRYSRHLKIKKTGIVKSHLGVKGTVHQSDEVIFPNVALGSLKLGNIKGFIDSDWLDSGMIIHGKNSLSSPRNNGVIGRSLLKKLKIIIDLRNEKLILADTISDLEKIGYFINEWPLINFYNTDIGIELDVKVNNKKGRFILDTGASHSLLRKTFFNEKDIDSQIDFFKADNLQIKNIDYPNFDFILLNFEQPAEVDGILGIDFFKGKMIFLDMQTNIIKIN